MNVLIDYARIDLAGFLVFVLIAFLLFALGFWFLGKFVEDRHPAFQAVVVILVALVPISSTDPAWMVMSGQVCVGLVAHRGWYLYQVLMYRNGQPLF